MNGKRRRRMMLIWAGLTIGLFMASPHVTAASPQEQTSAKQKTVHLRIAGMTCASCAKGLEASFRHMSGVQTVSVDYKTGFAVITFDPAKQTTQSLSKFVADCGYQVKETKVV